jgi:hypothetical protein
MKLTVISVLVILVLLPSAMAFDAVTGYFTSPYEGKDITVNAEIDSTFSANYNLGEGNTLFSVKVYGYVEGNGRVQLFAEDNSGSKFLIASYVYKEEGGLSNLITGFLSGVGNVLTGSVVAEGDYEPSRYLDAVCADTCDLEGNFKGNNLRITAEIEPGTKLNLYKLYYQTYNSETDVEEVSAPQESVLSKLWNLIFG